MNKLWNAVQAAALENRISVPVLVAVINQYLGTSYTTGRRGSQTPLYHAIRRGTVHQAEPPAFQKGKWVSVDVALHDYLNAVVERIESAKKDDERN